MKHAIITSFLGKLKDRFCEYQEPRTLEQKFEIMARIPGATGSEVVHPYEVPSPEELLSQLARFRFSVSAVNVNIKLDPIFQAGALTNPDPAVRKRAVQMIHAAKDYAAAIGADKVTCCPLSDGYDYSFQADYGKAWDRLVGAVRDAAAHRPEVPLFLEYKPSETRVHCTLDSAAKTLLLIGAAKAENLGVTLDIGHSIYGGETPAEAIALCAGSGVRYYVHINDNNGKWDWDLMAGTCNLWSYVEVLYYLKRYGYDGWITSDTSPVRIDPIECFAYNIRVTQRIWDWLDEIDLNEIAHHLERHDVMPVLKMLETGIFPQVAVSMRG